ncbi:ribosomal protein L17 [Dactylonectria macrodidyma]|uniref:Ribosomal protein L17 n=1 Tax=Dactylonectria macrodidyma TaxID=307937 RepID=A0A9P9EZB7_9HYPO|nr:ribosomal protein L17 [Dactylonectria macrodidyma]
MAGGLVKYRHLSRDSSARMALLRGLVSQLVQYEHIQTTYAKAKEAQRMAEKLITLAKRDNEPCRRSAQGILYTPHILLPKLFGELRQRYLPREGGYTRVVRTESKNPYDQGESAILEFVDGPKDSRFMMTAKTVARDRMLGHDHTAVTRLNIKKVTQFRGEPEFELMVQKFIALHTGDEGRHAADEADTSAERESASLSQSTQEKASQMAAGIVPESVKQAGRKNQNQNQNQNQSQ